MISKELIKVLREELPWGSASVIRQRLADKGIFKSIGTINATLDEDNPRFNEDVFNEAIEYRNFLREMKEKIKSKVMS